MKLRTSSRLNHQFLKITAPGIALRISFIYIAFGCLWILFSDQALALLADKPGLFFRISIFKGWFFVVFTGCMLFLLVFHSTRRSISQQAQMRHLINNIPDMVWLKDTQGTYLFCNPSFERFFGAKESEIVGRTDYDFVSRELADFFRQRDNEAISAVQPKKNEEWVTLADNGQRILLETIKTPMLDEKGMVLGVLGIGREITSLRKAQEALQESEEIFEQFMEHSPIYIFFKDEKIRSIRLSRNYEKMLGRPIKDLLGKTMDDLFPSELAKDMIADDKRILNEGHVIQVDEKLDGRFYTTIKFPIYLRGKPRYLAGYTMDITDRKRGEKEREKLETQLIQAQKMESVGRLAGGVAHDFNNILSVILGRSEMVMNELAKDSPLRSGIMEIRRAAERSADLTRQLLAFARKQTISPKVLNLNETVGTMLKMLRRLIGEDIELFWKPTDNLAPVYIDPSQIDQMLANLCVNARDAIGHNVGKITIETGLTELDEAYCSHHPDFVPGRYIVLTVSDNGSGMDEETKGLIFEPFFTTKDIGKGTGLGLATVYGIVKQNKGFINVYSEPGVGTTFRIYLPIYLDGRSESSREEDAGHPPDERGQETILLVEDEKAILDMIRKLLEGLGYRVLAASSPGEAIHIAREFPWEIQMLITDVIMPEMNGRDLAKNLLSIFPNLKRLFMSGYTANIIAHHGVLDEGVEFIQKPFSMKDLTTKVRAVLDQKE